jgi:hypothetical protein
MPKHSDMTREQRREEQRQKEGRDRVAKATDKEIKTREALEKDPNNPKKQAAHAKAVAAVKALGGGRRTRRHSRGRRRTARR